jgi:hypothetical protein
MRVHALLIASAITTILALPAMAPVIAQQENINSRGITRTQDRTWDI